MKETVETKAVITVTSIPHNDPAEQGEPWDIVFDTEAIESWDGGAGLDENASDKALVGLKTILDAYIELRNARRAIRKAEFMFSIAQHPEDLDF